jgi:SHAQKYF class myb-like DNA-binding protein
MEEAAMTFEAMTPQQRLNADAHSSMGMDGLDGLLKMAAEERKRSVNEERGRKDTTVSEMAYIRLQAAQERARRCSEGSGSPAELSWRRSKAINPPPPRGVPLAAQLQMQQLGLTRHFGRYSGEGYKKAIEPVICGRWTDEEQLGFTTGLQRYGRNWKMIQQLVQTRSLTQIRTHAQKFFKKVKKELELAHISGDSEAAERLQNLKAYSEKPRVNLPASAYDVVEAPIVRNEEKQRDINAWMAVQGPPPHTWPLVAQLHTQHLCLASHFEARCSPRAKEGGDTHHPKSHSSSPHSPRAGELHTPQGVAGRVSGRVSPSTIADSEEEVPTTTRPPDQPTEHLTKRIKSPEGGLQVPEAVDKGAKKEPKQGVEEGATKEEAPLTPKRSRHDNLRLRRYLAAQKEEEKRQSQLVVCRTQALLAHAVHIDQSRTMLDEVMRSTSGDASNTSGVCAIREGRWDEEEHRLFEEGMQLYKNDWGRVSAHIKTRTGVQVRTHAQKWGKKLEQRGHTSELLETAQAGGRAFASRMRWETASRGTASRGTASRGRGFVGAPMLLGSVEEKEDREFAQAVAMSLETVGQRHEETRDEETRTRKRKRQNMTPSSKRAGSKRSVPSRTDSRHRSTKSVRSGSDRSGSDRSGSSRAGPHRSGGDRSIPPSNTSCAKGSVSYAAPATRNGVTPSICSTDGRDGWDDDLDVSRSAIAVQSGMPPGGLETLRSSSTGKAGVTAGLLVGGSSKGGTGERLRTLNTSPLSISTGESCEDSGEDDIDDDGDDGVLIRSSDSPIKLPPPPAMPALPSAREMRRKARYA